MENNLNSQIEHKPIFTMYEISLIKGILRHHYNKIGTEIFYSDDLQEEIKTDFETILDKLEKMKY